MLRFTKRWYVLSHAAVLVLIATTIGIVGALWRGWTFTLPTGAAPSTHDALYGICATLIIAVLVVIYFDERVRRSLTARTRGYAIGSLGGVIGTGLLVPLFALAGFISDTTEVRAFSVGYTLLFLVVAFGAGIRVWGAEDAARLRGTRQPPAPVPPPAPRADRTEREYAAEVLGAALAVASEAQPDIVGAHLRRTGPGPEAERLSNLTARWMALQAPLIAISAGYPSADVRDRIGVFARAASRAIAHPAAMIANGQLPDGPPAQWMDEGKTIFDALQVAWESVVSALHPVKVRPAMATRQARAGRSRGGRASQSNRAERGVHIAGMRSRLRGSTRPRG